MSTFLLFSMYIYLSNFLEKGDTILAPQSEQMDAESADMLAALRRQIQPHLMMAALTPPRIPGAAHPPVPTAQLNYSLPLPSYMMHVSTIKQFINPQFIRFTIARTIQHFDNQFYNNVTACEGRRARTVSFIYGGRRNGGWRFRECLGRTIEPSCNVVIRRSPLNCLRPSFETALLYRYIYI